MRISLPAQPIETAGDWPFLRWLNRSLGTAGHYFRLYRRRRARRELLDLADRQLADIGLTREQAEEIGNRPFWR